METVATTVSILDRKYKLKIKVEEEQFLLKAAELIDTQARDYGKRYAYQDYQDLLAMAALTQITQWVKIQDTKDQAPKADMALSPDIQQRLLDIERYLSEAVGSNH